VNRRSRQPTRTIRVEPGARPSWSPDSTKLAVEIGYPDVSIQVLDAASGATLLDGEDPSW
jgi:hypothetical protein